MSVLKQTPIHSEHCRLGAKMAEYALYDMPIMYSSIHEEHLAVRNQVGLFDVSHMGEILVEGVDAEAFVNYIFTNNMIDAPIGKVVYGFLCYEDGGIVDDLLVYKYNTFKYLLVVNAGNKDKDYAYICDQVEEFNVRVTNLSDELSEVALQGPEAQALLQKLTDTDLLEITFFTFKDDVMIDGINCLVSRTGYTGEDGFEIYTKNEHITQIWNKLLEVGQAVGIKPIGLGARDTLRFEAALPLYGNELGKDITPIEASLKFFVKLDHDFIGKSILSDQITGSLTRKVVGLKVLDKGIIRHGYRVFNLAGEPIGQVTTGYLLPNGEYCVAMAMLDIAYTSLETPVLVEMRNKRLNAVVTGKKFMDKKYKK
jgi:aminomethyltransferase